MKEINEIILHTRSMKADFKKAYALVLTNNNVDQYQVLRSLIALGNLTESKNLIQTIEKKDYDYFLEKARINNMQGEWEQTISECAQGMKLEMPPRYMMAFLQVSSIAQYELGNFQECLNSINKIDSLSQIEEAPTLIFYNQLLKTKTEHLVQAEKNENEINLLLKQIITNNLLNPDTLLAWLRCKIDLMRMQNKPHAQFSNAAIAVARQLGDQLYLDLAILDHKVAISDQGDSTSFSSYKRVNNIAGSTTGKVMKSYLENGQKERRQKNLTVNETAKILIISEINLSINLEPFSFQFHTPREKSINALRLLYRGNISKEFFFKSLWNHQYSDHLHNNLIRTLVSRMRKTFSVEIASNKSVLSLKDAIVC